MAPKDNDIDKSNFRKVIEKNLLLLTTLAGVIIGIVMGACQISAYHTFIQ